MENLNVTTTLRTTKRSVYVLAYIFATAVSVRAESLSIEVRKGIVAPCEPFLVNVTWRMNKPLTNSNDARDVTENHYRIPRRIDGVLRQEVDGQCRFRLVPMSPFALVAKSDTEYSSLHLGFIYCHDDESRTDIYLTRAGEYTVTVEATTSSGSATSRPFAITIRKPARDETLALEMWEGLGVGETLSMILYQKGNESVVDVFRKLAVEHAETPYGRYARSSIAIWDFNDTVERFADKGGPNVWTPVANELRIAVAALDQLPALRKTALFDLVGAEICAGAYDRAREVAETIQKDFSDEDTRQKVDGLYRHLESRTRR